MTATAASLEARAGNTAGFPAQGCDRANPWVPNPPSPAIRAWAAKYPTRGCVPAAGRNPIEVSHSISTLGLFPQSSSHVHPLLEALRTCFSSEIISYSLGKIFRDLCVSYVNSDFPR